MDDIPWRGCIVYSAGTRDDASFDIGMTKKGCEVHSFDPSLSQMVEQGYGSTDHFLKGLKKTGVNFHEYGLGGVDLSYPPGTIPWSWPGIGYGAESNDGAWELKTLESTLQELGHSEGITVFKADIEGAEWAMLERMLSNSATRQMLKSGKLVRQMLLEVHLTPRFDKSSHAASSVRHPRSDTAVDSFNAHAMNLIKQLTDLNFVVWKHSLNTNVAINSPFGDAPCCHEVSLIWRQPAE